MNQTKPTAAQPERNDTSKIEAAEASPAEAPLFDLCRRGADRSLAHRLLDDPNHHKRATSGWLFFCRLAAKEKRRSACVDPRS
jgi:hypothetical protein